MSDPAVESTAKETEFPAAAAPAANGASNGAADSGGLRSGSPRSTDSDSDVSFGALPGRGVGGAAGQAACGGSGGSADSHAAIEREEAAEALGQRCSDSC